MTSVPVEVLLTAGFSAKEAKEKKKLFDDQEVQLAHLANGDVSQVQTIAVAHSTPRARQIY